MWAPPLPTPTSTVCQTGLNFMPVKVESVDPNVADSWKMVWDTAAGAESFGIPFSFFIFAGVTLAAIVFLNLTVWGRHLQAVGRNEEDGRKIPVFGVGEVQSKTILFVFFLNEF